MKRPKKGDVWRYEYLRHREREAGKDNARKSRPAALATAYAGKDGRINLFWIPITGKEPRKDRLAIEVPQIERKRAGLASDMRLWMIVDEYNHEFLETSFHIDPDGYQGAFSAAFTDKALDLLIGAGKKGSVEHGEASRWAMPFGAWSIRSDTRRRVLARRMRRTELPRVVRRTIG